MFDLAETISGWIYALRITTWQQWLLRAGILIAGGLAGWLASSWVAVNLVPIWGAVVIVGVLWSAIRPDSLAPLFTTLPIALAWVGGEVEWPRMAATALLIGLFHVGAAFAAAAPPYAAGVVKPENDDRRPSTLLR